jgi:hypothetical protein
MSFSIHKKIIILVTISILIVGYYAINSRIDNNDFDQIQWQKLADQCDIDYDNESAKVNCWLHILETIISQNGIDPAYKIFSYLYETYDLFSNSGCHRQAHRMGDFAYYNIYWKHKDIEKMSFPQSANACGFGFYHGFIEHFIQDNPETEFAENNCLYLIDKLKDTAPQINYICYHASGHGFLIAEADKIFGQQELSIVNVTAEPIKKCDSFKTDDKEMIRECREGVFNVFVDWMVEGDFGLSYNYEEPFLPCEPLINDKYTYQNCSIEISRKFDSLSNYSITRALEIVKTNPDSDIHGRMFQITVTGIVQHNPKAEPLELAIQCRDMESDFKEICFEALISGLFEHGHPGQVYQGANVFCSNDSLQDTEKEICYKVTKSKLYRFYSKNEIDNLCSEQVLSEGICNYLKNNSNNEV